MRSHSRVCLGKQPIKGTCGILHVDSVLKGGRVSRKYRKQRANDLVDGAAIKFVDDDGFVKLSKHDTRNKSHFPGSQWLISTYEVLRTP